MELKDIELLLDRKLEPLKNDIADIKGSVNDINRRVDEIKVRVDDINDRLILVEKKVDIIEKKVDIISDNLRKVMKAVPTENDDIEEELKKKQNRKHVA
jgi:phage-related tail protein